MKNKFLTIGIFLMTTLLTFSSCKKDDDIHVPSQKVNGTFHAFEASINGGAITAMPTEDEKIDIQIKTIDEKHATVIFIDYYKDNSDTLPPVNCTIGKTEDGFTILDKKTSTGSLSVMFYDKNTIEFNATGDDTNVYVAASKNGKKPDWWD